MSKAYNICAFAHLIVLGHNTTIDRVCRQGRYRCVEAVYLEGWDDEGDVVGGHAQRDVDRGAARTMRNSTFLAITVVVVLLVLAMIYMHRPRSGSSARSQQLHGGR